MNICPSPDSMFLAAVDLDFPFPFLLCAAVLLGLMAEACYRSRRVWSIPSLLVYITVGAWYLGNMITDGPAIFLSKFGSSLTNEALWQTLLFLAAYRLAVQHLLPQRNVLGSGLSVSSHFPQDVLTSFFFALVAFWLVLFAIGVARADWQVAAVIWPPVSAMKVGLFTRDGIGQGADFLVSTGAYVYVVVCASFGVLAILARGPTRWFSGALFAFVAPYFLFERARSAILAFLLPAVFCYFVATWGHWWKKAVVCAALVLALKFWFGQVMHSRSDNGENRVASMLETSSEEDSGGMLGLDMLSELCYMDAFVREGSYQPNWGERYFAELANAVPRTLWPNKPLIGYDYAYVRGYRDSSGGEEDAVYATISTGMIGQGIANFGRFFGVVAAALLMTGWTFILSKLWLRRFELPRFLLFSVGCGLTFNLGRDITLLVLWPFVFAYGLVRLVERFQPKGTFDARRSAPARRPYRAGVPALPRTP